MEVTQGEGLCGFYIRCPDGTSITVTLFVGKLRKGPISARFEHVPPCALRQMDPN